MFCILHSEVFLFTVLTPFGEKKKTFGDDAYLSVMMLTSNALHIKPVQVVLVFKTTEQ